MARGKGTSKFQGVVKTGMVFSEWTVISDEVIVDREANVLCRCMCGTEKRVNVYSLMTGVSTKCTICAHHNRFGPKNPNWKGEGDVSIRMLKKAKSEDDKLAILEEWDKCGGKCYLTNWEISFKDRTASLDRIDSNKGYIRGNIRWVHQHANIAKNMFDLDHFITLCHSVANTHKNPMVFENSTVFGDWKNNVLTQ